jgi:hypothetical protein
MWLKLAKIEQKWNFSIFLKKSHFLIVFVQNCLWRVPRPDRKNGINLIPSRYHWDQLDAKVIVLDINFPVRDLKNVKNCRKSLKIG